MKSWKSIGQKKKQGLVLKVDFEKAYDHVRRGCLDRIMEKKGFGDKWRKWIKGCVSTENFSIMINGNQGDFFEPLGDCGKDVHCLHSCSL